MNPFRMLPLDIPGFDLPAAFAVRFDVQHAADADFAWHGIPFPSSLERAVLKRRVEFLAGRRCALEALRACGALVSDLPIGPDRAPVWPEGFLGSITHAGTIAAAVALPAGGTRGVGIDIECVASGPALDALETTVAGASERGAMDALVHAMGRAEAFTVVFSAKESFYKATARAVGRVFDFSAVHVVGTPEPGLLELEVAENLVEGLSRGQRMQVRVSSIDTQTLMTACAW